MSSTLLRYHNKTVTFLPMRRSRQWRAVAQRARRRVSRRVCKRALRSVTKQLSPFQN